MTKPIPGSYILDALKEERCIVMACNTRIVPGIVKGIFRAAKDTDSPVMFELARSECNLDGGYTGLTPATFAAKVMEAAADVGFDIWALHADHIGIKKGTPEDMEETKKLISAQIDAGFTSFAIDASHLFDFEGSDVCQELRPNIDATVELARFIKERMGDSSFGLEVEVGEIGRKNDEGMVLTTPEQAIAFIKCLNDEQISPNALAIANGSSHGNIYDKDGNPIAQVSIDIPLTKAIARSLRDDGYPVRIAQHGITGTPREFIRTMFPHGDIIKGNVGTFWQNLAHEVLKVYEPELYGNMRSWVIENYREKAAKKDLKNDEQIMGVFGKFATKRFFDEIYGLKPSTIKAIEDYAYAEAKLFFEAFQSCGKADHVRRYLS